MYADAAVDKLVFLLRHPFVVQGKQVFRKLPVHAGVDLATSFAGSVIVEYPTVVVLLPGYDTDAFPLINELPIDAIVPVLPVDEPEASSDESDATSSSDGDTTSTDSESSEASASSSEDSESSSSESDAQQPSAGTET